MQIDNALQNERNCIANVLRQMELDEWRPEVVVGVARGGLTPAVIISHALDIPMVPLTWSTRDYIARESKAYDLIADYQNVLIVDDIVDSGLTLDELQRALGGADQDIRYASLYLRFASTILPDYVGKYVNNSDWIEFSWELFGANLRQKGTH